MIGCNGDTRSAIQQEIEPPKDIFYIRCGSENIFDRGPLKKLLHSTNQSPLKRVGPLLGVDIIETAASAISFSRYKVGQICCRHASNLQPLIYKVKS